MTKSRESELTTDLMRAQIRLGMIARMAKLSMEETPKEHEVAEVMQTILAACGLEEEHRRPPPKLFPTPPCLSLAAAKP